MRIGVVRFPTTVDFRSVSASLADSRRNGLQNWSLIVASLFWSRNKAELGIAFILQEKFPFGFGREFQKSGYISVKYRELFKVRSLHSINHLFTHYTAAERHFFVPLFSPLVHTFNLVISHRLNLQHHCSCYATLIESLKYRLPLKLQTKWGLQPFLSSVWIRTRTWLVTPSIMKWTNTKHDGNSAELLRTCLSNYVCFLELSFFS